MGNQTGPGTRCAAKQWDDELVHLVRLLARAAAAEYVQGRAAGMTTPQKVRKGRS